MAPRRRNLLAAATFAAIALAAAAFWFFVVRKPQVPVEAIRPHAISSYDGIALGMTMDDVMRAKGAPSAVYGPPEIKSGVPVQEPMASPPKDVRAMADAHDDWWSYKRPGGARIDVYFSPSAHKVMKITCQSRTRRGACPAVFGIRIGTSREDVFSTLGAPDLEDAEQGAVVLSYQRYALEFELVRGRVSQIGVVKTVPVPATP